MVTFPMVAIRSIAAPQAVVASSTQPPTPDVIPQVPPVPAIANQAGPAAASGTPVGVNVPGIGSVVPMTRDQVRAFDRRGELLSDQLNSAVGRRKDLIRELSSTTSPTVKSGLEARIQFLDERLLSLEQEISENSAQKASLPATLRTSTSSSDAPAAPSRRNSDNGGFLSNPIEIGMVIILVITASRFFARRAASTEAAAPSPAIEARFQQMEQAIDTVAIEIERVAEGQRFVSKLLREGQPVPDFAPARAGETVGMRNSVEDAR